MELEPRTTAPAHATGAVEFVPLAEISDDATFRLREEGDVAALAASLGRLGQLVPVELRPLPGALEGGPSWQVVAGFRRVAAARLLARERILARVHEALGDEDALALALAEALLHEPLLASELEALRERLAASGGAPWAEELLPAAFASAPLDPRLRERFRELVERGEAELAEPAGAEVAPGAEVGAEVAPEAEATELEVTPEELVDDLARRMYEVNQDLTLAFGAWSELPREGRRMILVQARWVRDLLAHVEDEP